MDDKRPVKFWPDFWVWRLFVVLLILAIVWAFVTTILAFTGWGQTVKSTPASHDRPTPALMAPIE